jgi:hypothetical protein
VSLRIEEAGGAERIWWIVPRVPRKMNFDGSGRIAATLSLTGPDDDQSLSKDWASIQPTIIDDGWVCLTLSAVGFREQHSAADDCRRKVPTNTDESVEWNWSVSPAEGASGKQTVILTLAHLATAESIASQDVRSEPYDISVERPLLNKYPTQAAAVMGLLGTFIAAVSGLVGIYLVKRLG